MVLALFGSQHVEALAISVGTVAPSAMPTSLGTASLSFACSPGRQHALTLRGVEMSAGMWAGKKKRKEANLEARPNLLLFILEPGSDIRAGRV